MYPIEYFWRAAHRFPDRTAVVGPGGALTFNELARTVMDRAGAISALDPALSSMICVGAANTVDHLISILAVMAAGKVWVPLNPRSGDPDLQRQIAFVRPALVLADAGMRERIASDAFPVTLLSDLGGGAGSVARMGPMPGPGIPLHQTQAVKFTGGTTGFPKGVKQPLRAWNANIVTQIHTLGLTCEDRYLVAAPLTHGTGTYMLPVLGSGGALVFPDHGDPAGLLDAAARHRVSLFFAPPTLILSLIEEQRRRRARSRRAALSRLRRLADAARPDPRGAGVFRPGAVHLLRTDRGAADRDLPAAGRHGRQRPRLGRSADDPDAGRHRGGGRHLPCHRARRARSPSAATC